jgi:hypothetical protein
VLRSPLSLFGMAVILASAAAIPLVQADCQSGSCPAPVYTPGYTPPCPSQPPVFVSPFVPLDQFIFVGVPTTANPVLTVAAPAAAAQPPAGGPAAQPDDIPAGMPAVKGWHGRPTAAAGPDLHAVAEALVSCTTCHTGPNGKYGVNIFAAGGAFQPNVKATAINESVKDDSMPLRGPKLTTAQKNVIAAWEAATKKGT